MDFFGSVVKLQGYLGFSAPKDNETALPLQFQGQFHYVLMAMTNIY